MILRLSILVLATIAGPQIATAQAVHATANNYNAPQLTPRAVANKRYLDRMSAIRTDALAQRDADGGALTAEHRDAIQARIDKVEGAYRRELRRNDPRSVDANGVPVG
jgi:hypothetical protein